MTGNSRKRQRNGTWSTSGQHTRAHQHVDQRVKQDDKFAEFLLASGTVSLMWNEDKVWMMVRKTAGVDLQCRVEEREITLIMKPQRMPSDFYESVGITTQEILSSGKVWMDTRGETQEVKVQLPEGVKVYTDQCIKKSVEGMPNVVGLELQVVKCLTTPIAIM